MASGVAAAEAVGIQAAEARRAERHAAEQGRELAFDGRRVTLDKDLVVRFKTRESSPLRLTAFRNPDGALPDGLALAPWERPSEIPPEKVLNTIQCYGNTTAATVPLTIDHWRKLGKVKKGDRVLASVFGSGYTWGAAIFQV